MKKQTCKYCQGVGRYKWEKDDPIPDEECAACHGKGQVEKQLKPNGINYR